MMLLRRRAPALAAAATLLAVPLLSACDSAPGPFEGQPLPQISNVEVTPTTIDFQSDAAAADVPLVIRADVSAAAEVRVLVRYAESDSDTPLADVTAQVQPGRAEVAVPLQIPRGAIGDYQVTMLTEGADGRPGDRVQAVLAFAASSLGAPSVEVTAPATVAPGGRLDVVATVTDPDGAENVALVLLTDEFGGVIAQLRDTGGRADEVAGDGRFGESLQLNANAEPGDITLRVVAIDRSGLESEPALFTVTVQ